VPSDHSAEPDPGVALLTLRLAAPAKVNLGLRITARRPDGYHEFESVFAPLDLADEVVLEVSDAPEAAVDFALASVSAHVPDGTTNLAARAAAGFLAAADLKHRVSVHLTKRVPAAAGLGGGSSDAGAVLRGLTELLPGALEPRDLEILALGLGADVPYFLAPRPSLVSGVGELREPLAATLSPLVLLLANPGEALATERVYAAFDALTPEPAGPGLRELVHRVFEGPGAAGLPELLRNDLEPAAVGLCPAVARLREALHGAGASAVALSGSGATVFGVFPGFAEAEAALGKLRARTPRRTWLRVARTLEAG